MCIRDRNTVAYDNSSGGIYTPPAGTVFGTSVAHQVSVVDSGTAIATWQDAAVSQASQSYSRSGHPLTPDRFTLGGMYFNSTSPSVFWNGYIAEMVVWTSALSIVQRQAGEANQKGYFSTP